MSRRFDLSRPTLFFSNDRIKSPKSCNLHRPNSFALQSLEGERPPYGNIIHCYLEMFGPTVVPGFFVDTRPRSDADAASGDRPPTASETESKIFQTGFSLSREDCYGENLDHQAVLVRQSPKHLLHIYQRDPRTNLEGNAICSPIVRRSTVVICANAQTSRELHVESILKVEKTGYHNPPKLEIQLPRNTKFSTKRTNRDDTNDMWWQYKIWLLSGYLCRNKIAPDTLGSSQRFLSPASLE